jgi:Glutathione-dependent formaldehyde-activating enzyme
MSVEGPERFTGGCLCGSVRIVASGRPYRVGVCHCLDCRKHHGALFHASAIFPQDAVTIYPFDATRTPNAQELWQRLLGQPVSESGRFRHGERGQGPGDRRRMALMSTILYSTRMSPVIPAQS